jgi:hypothetical protein
VIRVWRAGEPWELRRSRARNQGALEEKVTRGEALARGDFKYEDAREPLMLDQHFKCAFCDTAPRRRATVDHFRPAVAAKGQGQPGTAPTGYWWLGMCWENLLYVCDGCNRAKGDRFPLQAGSPRLATGTPPPGSERPLLLDPASEDLSEHILFFPDGPVWPDGDGRWRPTARDGSERGKETLEKIGVLDDQAYFKHLDSYVRDHILKKVEAIQSALSGGLDPEPVWSDACELLAPEREYSLLTYDILAHYFADEIEAGQLTLPKPWLQPPTSPRAPTAQEAAISALPAPLQEQLSAIHKKSPRADKLEVLFQLCAHTPRSADELALLFGLTDNTVLGYLREEARLSRREDSGLWGPAPPAP